MRSSRLWCCNFTIAILCTVSAQTVRAEQADLTELSLEQLMQVEVTSASKHLQSSKDAPSAVQVITREDIRLHGWRTLTEALVSLPGMYASSDRAYDYLGARGFLIPGDYNTRFLLLIDGQRNNDNIYQQAVIGGEGWLDMAMVERIEYIPGPGSAIYGSNAMFGVINVITRKADSVSQSQVGTYVSKLGQTGVSVMTGGTKDGTGLIFQYSAEHQAGRDLTYSDPLGNLQLADGSTATDTTAHGLDTGNNRRMMVRVDHDELSLKLINHKRTLRPSSAPYWTVFNDPSIEVLDEGTQLSATLQHELSEHSSIYARLGYTDWSYQGTYPSAADPLALTPYYRNYDDVRGRILDGEFRYRLKSGAHQLLGGTEFSRDLEASQVNSYSIDPALLTAANANINLLMHHSSLFVQDEWSLGQAWMLNLSLRLDQATASDSRYSPRAGLIWQPDPSWTAKLLTGRAFRNPNAYESQFTDGVNYLSNPGLQAETITTTEGVLEWLGMDQTRLQVSLYENKLDHLIRQVDTGGLVFQYQNGAGVKVQGLELGVEKTTAADLKVRASVSTSRPQSTQGTRLGNSPSWMAKAAASTPILGHTAHLAAEVQAISNRSYIWGLAQYHTGVQVVTNATVTFPNVLTKGLQLQLRAANLFNRSLQHPAAEEMPVAAIPQNGRNLTASVEYAF